MDGRKAPGAHAPEKYDCDLGVAGLLLHRGNPEDDGAMVQSCIR
jgi:hypothetical protein